MRCCLQPGCPELVHKGRCARHGGESGGWARRPNSPERMRGRKLQAARQRLFAQAQYTCAVCGRVTVDLVRDHVVPLAEGGEDVESNTQALCAVCHDSKTRQESVRGQARAIGRGE